MSFCWGFYVAGLMIEERKGSCGKIGIKGVGSGGLGGRAFSGVCKKLTFNITTKHFLQTGRKSGGGKQPIILKCTLNFKEPENL